MSEVDYESEPDLAYVLMYVHCRRHQVDEKGYIYVAGLFSTPLPGPHEKYLRELHRRGLIRIMQPIDSFELFDACLTTAGEAETERLLRLRSDSVLRDNYTVDTLLRWAYSTRDTNRSSTLFFSHMASYFIGDQLSRNEVGAAYTFLVVHGLLRHRESGEYAVTDAAVDLLRASGRASQVSRPDGGLATEETRIEGLLGETSLVWLHERMRRTREVEIVDYVVAFTRMHPFHGVSDRTIVKLLERKGFLFFCGNHREKIRLTEAGEEAARKLLRRQHDAKDRVRRSVELFTEWLYENSVDQAISIEVARFLDCPEALFDGARISENELQQACNLLKNGGLIQSDGEGRVKLTEMGLTSCRMDFSAERQTEREGKSNYYVFVHNSRNVTIGEQRDFTQNAGMDGSLQD
ncbi:hypothetical protein [Streptomyces sp. AC154]|uniref:hypothetical protein n=1 Tax=Streptomyces sp. AC154 TaxID=3143184 RepID=UPI003F80901B